MKTFLFLCFIILTGHIYSQKELKYISENDFITVETEQSFAISKTPVLNKEYLTFIMWNMNTYGADYPEVFISLIPGLKQEDHSKISDEMYTISNPFEIIFKYGPTYVKDYIFNPAYANFPVIGVSWVQASTYNKWLSDRYNEYYLIKQKYIEYDQFQSGSECFITESLYTDQFAVNILKEKIYNIDRFELIPAFRLPTINELIDVKKKVPFESKTVSYKKQNKKFINFWTNRYLEFNDSELVCKNHISLNDTANFYKISSKNIIFDLNTVKPEEMILEKNKTEKSKTYTIAFSGRGFTIKAAQNFKDKEGYYLQKNKYGLMPFIIIDKDINNHPVLIENYCYSNSSKEDDNQLHFFRSVLNLQSATK